MKLTADTRARLVDNGIRYGGAFAVVFTVEAVSGYFLWLAATIHVGLPDALGWAPQFGLVGSAAVGTRAWHRGLHPSASWGKAASLVGLAFTIVDAGTAALLHDNLIKVPAGVLGLVLIVQCVTVGWLAIHTVFSAPRVAAPATDEVAAVEPPREPQVWGMDEETPRLPDCSDDVAPDMPELEPATAPEPDGDDTGPLPVPTALDEHAAALATLRQQHGIRGKHKERADLGVGWNRYNAAADQLNTRRNGHGAHSMST